MAGGLAGGLVLEGAAAQGFAVMSLEMCRDLQGPGGESINARHAGQQDTKGRRYRENRERSLAVSVIIFALYIRMVFAPLIERLTFDE